MSHPDRLLNRKWVITLIRSCGKAKAGAKRAAIPHTMYNVTLVANGCVTQTYTMKPKMNVTIPRMTTYGDIYIDVETHRATKSTSLELSWGLGFARSRSLVPRPSSEHPWRNVVSSSFNISNHRAEAKLRRAPIMSITRPTMKKPVTSLLEGKEAAVKERTCDCTAAKNVAC